MKEAFFYSLYISIASSLLVVFTFFIRYGYTEKRSRSKPFSNRRLEYSSYHMRVPGRTFLNEDKCRLSIFLLAIISFNSDVTNIAYLQSGHVGDVVNNVFLFLQFLLLSVFYHHLQDEGSAFRSKNIATKVFIGFAFFVIGYTLYLGNLFSYQSLTWFFESLVLIAYSVYSFIRMRGGPFVDDPDTGLLPESRYTTVLKIISAPVWINLGVLLYFSGGLIISFIREYMHNVFIEKAYILWFIQNLLNSIKNIFFAIGLYYAGKYGIHRRTRLVTKKYKEEYLPRVTSFN